MSGKKGIYGSKQLVKCGYCNEHKRKDNLQRHIDNKHPGKPFKFTFITCSSGGIKNFLKPPENISSDTFSIPTEEEENIEVDDHVNPKLCVEYEVDENTRDNLKRKDKQCGEHSNKKQLVFRSEGDIIKQIENLQSTFLEKFQALELKVENISNNLTETKDSSHGNKIVKSTDDEKTVYEELVSSIKNSKNIESLEILLHSAKVYRNDITPIDCFYYCGICFDGNVPSAKNLYG